MWGEWRMDVAIQPRGKNGDLFEWGVGILRISNKIESRRDLHRHSQLPTPNSKLLDKFQFVGVD